MTTPETDPAAPTDDNQSGLPPDDPRVQPKAPPTETEPGLGEIPS